MTADSPAGMPTPPPERRPDVTAWLAAPPSLRSDIESLNSLIDDAISLIRSLNRDVDPTISSSEPRRYRMTPEGRALLNDALRKECIRYFVFSTSNSLYEASASVYVNIADRGPDQSSASVSFHLRIQPNDFEERPMIVTHVAAFIQKWFIALGCAAGWISYLPPDSTSITAWELKTTKRSLPDDWRLVTRHGRGGFWGNLLSGELCERLGGTDRVLRDAPVFRAQMLAHGLWLQLTEDFPSSDEARDELTRFLGPILNWTYEDLSRWHTKNWLEDYFGGLIGLATPLPRGNPPEYWKSLDFPVLSYLRFEADHIEPEGDDVTYNLYLERPPSTEEIETLSTIITAWSQEQMSELGYGWFHYTSELSVNGSTIRWYVDTSGAGVKVGSLTALKGWLHTLPQMRVVQLVLGREIVG